MPGRPDRALVSMGIYVFLSDYLAHQLRQDQTDDLSAKDFGKNIIPRLIAQGYRVQAYFFGKPGGFEPEYWRDVGTVDAYFQANMELVSQEVPARYRLVFLLLFLRNTLPYLCDKRYRHSICR